MYNRPVRASRWWLIGLCVLTFGVGLGGLAISESDEAYYAEAGREMVDGGDYLTPRFNYANRFEKPILFYWVVSAGYRALGVSEFAARIGAAVSGLGLVLLTAWAGRRWYDEATGLLAGAIVATAFGSVALARTARPEMLLALLIAGATVSGLLAIEEGGRRSARWWGLAAGAAALACLTKGPVGLAMPGLVLLPIAATGRRWHRLRIGPLLLAALVFLLVAVPWYALMAREHGLSYLHGFFVGDNLDRFATTRYNDPRSVFYYLPAVLGGLLPWSLFFVLALPSAFRRWRRVGRLAVRDVQVLVWALLPLLLLTASVGKQAHYALPVLPPISLLLARLVRGCVEPDARPGRDLRRRLFRAAGVCAGLLLCGGGLLAARLAPLLQLDSPAALAVTAGVACAAGLSVAVLSLSSRWRVVPAAVAAATAAVVVALQPTIAAAPGSRAVVRVAEQISVHRRAGEPIGTYRVFGRNLVFYTHVQQTPLYSLENVETFLASSDRVLCVLPEDDATRLTQPDGRPWRRLWTLRYLDLATAKPRVLLRPDASRDLRTVVLISNR